MAVHYRNSVKYSLAESAKVFHVDAGQEVRLGVSQRHHASVVLVKAMTRGAADVMRTWLWRHTSVTDWPRQKYYTQVTQPRNSAADIS